VAHYTVLWSSVTEYLYFWCIMFKQNFLVLLDYDKFPKVVNLECLVLSKLLKCVFVGEFLSSKMCFRLRAQRSNTVVRRKMGLE
jgi:hypothetical protein